MARLGSPHAGAGAYPRRDPAPGGAHSAGTRAPGTHPAGVFRPSSPRAAVAARR